MDLSAVLREALELQILEQEPESAAGVIGSAVGEHGAAPVAQAQPVDLRLLEVDVRRGEERREVLLHERG